MAYYCPYCGQELEVGDGRFAPPLFCERCGEAWDRPEDGRFYIPLPQRDTRQEKARPVQEPRTAAGTQRT